MMMITTTIMIIMMIKATKIMKVTMIIMNNCTIEIFIITIIFRKN